MKLRTTLLGLASLLAVIVVTLVLIGLFVGRASPKVKVGACENELTFLRGQFEIYKWERGDYPSGEQGLNALVQPASPPFHQLLSEIPLDPWGRIYRYIRPGRKNPERFDLFSLGPDGRESADDIYPQDGE